MLPYCICICNDTDITIVFHGHGPMSAAKRAEACRVSSARGRRRAAAGTCVRVLVYLLVFVGQMQEQCVPSCTLRMQAAAVGFLMSSPFISNCLSWVQKKTSAPAFEWARFSIHDPRRPIKAQARPPKTRVFFNIIIEVPL
jgi:hypothetical protein